MTEPDDRSVYPIERVAELLSIKIETIKKYEHQGLIHSCSIESASYTHRQVRRIQRAETVVGLGVNLAGAEVICNLLERVDELTHEIEVRKEQIRRLLED